MATDELRTRIQNPPELAGVIVRLGQADNHIQARNRATVEAFTDASVLTAKQMALGLPVKPPRDRGLRQLLSKGVGRRKTRHGYRVTTSMPPGYTWYPRYIESQWRHPTFGGPPVVTQRENWDWFRGPIAKFHAPMQSRLEENIEDTVRFIAG